MFCRRSRFMPETLAYLNGDWLPAERMALPVHDAGFVFGATITDLCRTFRHRLFRWADHLNRFRQSCLAARVPLEASDDELTSVAGQLAEHNGGLLRPEQEFALVVFATPGPIGYYLGEPGGP